MRSVEEVSDNGGVPGLDEAWVSPSPEPCSICLEAVKDDGGRSIARLVCGHQFHLDCVGSAFNAKGVMQCPNCRTIEKGNWLYPNGEISMEDVHDHNLDSHSAGIHPCPYLLNWASPETLLGPGAYPQPFGIQDSLHTWHWRQNSRFPENQFYPWERDQFSPFPLVPLEREAGWWGPSHPPFPAPWLYPFI